MYHLKYRPPPTQEIAARVIQKPADTPGNFFSDFRQHFSFDLLHFLFDFYLLSLILLDRLRKKLNLFHTQANLIIGIILLSFS